MITLTALSLAIILTQVTAIEHVTVLPMDGRDSLSDQTVLVRGASIARVALAGSFAIPAGARRIDGRGQYLLPGLADMHVHPYDTDGLPSYLAYGVTTIAVMHGFPDVVAWRERIKRGTLVGPTIYSAGPTVNGYPAGNPLFVSVEDPAAARAVVRQQHAAGYDFVKVYSMLELPEYEAILSEAKRLGMPVFGHIPWSAGYLGAMERGQAAVAHVEEFFNVGIKDSMFADAVRVAREHGTAVTANLYAYAEMLAEAADIPALLRSPEMRYHSPAGLSEKLPSSNRSLRGEGFWNFLRGQQPRMRRLVKMLFDAGVPVFGGTDTETFGFPGESLLGELHELALAGLTNYQALECVTKRTGDFFARWMPKEQRFGTVTQGSRADLVLLDANPLVDLENLRRVRGVMTRGRWHTREAIQVLRDSIAARNAIVQPLTAQLDSLAMKANDGPAAVALFERLRRDYPTVVPVAELVVRGYGRTLFLKGDRPNAVQLRLLAEQLYPKSHSAANEVGRGYLYSGDTTSALEHFRRSLTISPYNTQVRRMVDKLEDARRPPKFAPAGRYVLDSVGMKINDAPTMVGLALAVADSMGHWLGTLRFNGKEARCDDLVIGADRVWASADIDDRTVELELRVTGDTVAGVVAYGWGNTRAVRGRRDRAP